MSLLSNYIGEISPAQFGNGQNGTSNVDLNDTTFSDLLEKQMNVSNDNNINPTGNFSGFDIGLLDGVSPIFETNKIQEHAVVNKAESSGFNFFSNLKEYTTSDVITFFPSLFDSKPTLTQTQSNGLFDFERKVAATSYGQYAKNIVTDLQEFVTDTMKARA